MRNRGTCRSRERGWLRGLGLPRKSFVHVLVLALVLAESLLNVAFCELTLAAGKFRVANIHRCREEGNSAAEPKIKPSVIHIVREGSFVHCHLACGHMITMHPEDLKESPPSAIECWACEEESKKGFLSR